MPKKIIGIATVSFVIGFGLTFAFHMILARGKTRIYVPSHCPENAFCIQEVQTAEATQYGFPFISRDIQTADIQGNDPVQNIYPKYFMIDAVTWSLTSFGILFVLNRLRYANIRN